MSFSFPVLALLIALPVVCSWPFVRSWARRRPVDPFEVSVIFSLNFLLGFWLKPILSIWAPAQFTAAWYHTAPEGHDQGILILALALALAGILVFYVGYYVLPWGKWLAGLLPRPRWPWRPRRLRLALPFSVLLSLSLTLYFLGRGQFSAVYLAENRGTEVLGAGVAAGMFVASTVLCFLLLFVYLRQLRVGRWARLAASWCLTLIALGILAIFAARGNLFLVLGSALMVRHYCIRRFSVVDAIGISIGLAVFSTGFFLLRTWFVIGEAPPLEHFYDAFRLDFVSLTTGWEGFLLVLASYPSVHPFYHGALTGGDILWLVPRALWPGKPEMYGSFLIQRDLLPNLWSPAAHVGTFEAFSPLGVGYADFGVAGALLMMLFHGVFWRMIYGYLRRDGGRISPPAAAVYGLAVFSLSTYARGAVGGMLALLVLWLPIVVVVGWLGGQRRHTLRAYPVSIPWRQAASGKLHSEEGIGWTHRT